MAEQESIMQDGMDRINDAFRSIDKEFQRVQKQFDSRRKSFEKQITGQRKIDVFDFATDVIEPGSVLYTDGGVHYLGIGDHVGLTHEQIELVHADEPAHAILPAVHRVASLLKRWLAGTLHYGQSTTHLDYYLDEFTFRFNRRTSRSRGLLFYRLLQQAVNTDPHPLHELLAPNPSLPVAT